MVEPKFCSLVALLLILQWTNVYFEGNGSDVSTRQDWVFGIAFPNRMLAFSNGRISYSVGHDMVDYGALTDCGGVNKRLMDILYYKKSAASVGFTFYHIAIGF